MPQDTTNFQAQNPTHMYPSHVSYVRQFIKSHDEAVNPTDTLFDKSVILKQNHKQEIIISKPSLFTIATLKETHICPKKISNYNTDWITWLLIFCFALYAFLQKNFIKKQRVLVNAFLNHRYTNQLIREGNVYSDYSFFVMVGLSIILFALTLILFYAHFLTSGLVFFNSFDVFIKILFAVVIIYFGRIVLFKVASSLFNLHDLYDEFLLSQHIFIIFWGLISLFMSLLLAYTSSQIFFWTSIIVYSLIFLNHLFRLFMTTIGNGKYSLFYFFLYICTIEILPLLLIYKLLNLN